MITYDEVVDREERNWLYAKIDELKLKLQFMEADHPNE